MKRVVITGPTGAIGIALIKQMIERRVEVLAICNPNSQRISRIPNSPLVKIVKCELNELMTAKVNITGKYDVFYHLGWCGTFGGARNDMYLQNNNVRISLIAVELAKQIGCHTFIGAGSQAEYGRTEETLSYRTAVKPENGYGIAKLCAGQMTRLFCEQNGLKHIWFRVLSIYGPYDGEETLIMSMIRQLLSGEIPKTTGGEQLWDYLYSQDAGRAFYLAGIKGKHGAVYCLGSGVAVPLKEYMLIVRDTIDRKLKVEIGGIDYSPNQVMYLCADISNLTEDTGFVPEIKFEEGVRRTVLWYKDQIEHGDKDEEN